MKNIIIFVLAENKKRYRREISDIEACVKELNYTPRVIDDINDVKYNDISLIITIGGDGTILRASMLSRILSVPILGVSCGRLGFLAEIPFPDIRTALSWVDQGDYIMDQRNFLEVIHDGQQDYALNEVAVHTGTSSMVECDVYLNDVHLTVYRADGLIVSSATGSTAYNLSAGGPIIFPDTEAMIITPICSHSLTVRPLVISARDRLRIQPVHGRVSLSVDGEKGQVLKGQHVSVMFSSEKVSFIRFSKYSFIDGLKDKLNWSGKI